MNKYPYLTLGCLNYRLKQPPTYLILKYKVGDKVRIRVNYLADLPEDLEPVWESTITEVDLNDIETPYYIGEIRCYFREDELEFLN